MIPGQPVTRPVIVLESQKHYNTESDIIIVYVLGV